MEPSASTLCPLEPTQHTRNESLNETTLSSDLIDDYSYVFTFLAICLLGLGGNGLLIWFLIFCIRKNPFTIYVLHLAIADFMVLLCSCIIELVNTFHIRDFILLVCAVVFMVFGYNTGLHLLTAISVERCLSVLYPIWYQCQRPKHQSAVVCVLLWALSVLVSFLENFFCILSWQSQTPECRHVYIFSCTLTFLVFVPLMVFSNLVLFIQACCSLKTRQPVKLYVVIMATVILFLVFAMPMKVLFIVAFCFSPSDGSVWQSLPYLNMLSIINCSVNPIIYFVVGSLRKKKSKNSIKEALQKVFEEKAVVGSRENVAHSSQPS
ncbi:mas-related G-protein coupled receptor member H-like [Acomys russatus]|uniref:mas-related G-protein coupled receptor member H-like n=1 Tax=Acomys russatus TaxID=60746 RepID=UPI0021E31EDC|nr:mas-related G-protein coupled receptor member H-like [Acomys russatus]